MLHLGLFRLLPPVLCPVAGNALFSRRSLVSCELVLCGTVFGFTLAHTSLRAPVYGLAPQTSFYHFWALSVSQSMNPSFLFLLLAPFFCVTPVYKKTLHRLRVTITTPYFMFLRVPSRPDYADVLVHWSLCFLLVPSRTFFPVEFFISVNPELCPPGPWLVHPFCLYWTFPLPLPSQVINLPLFQRMLWFCPAFKLVLTLPVSFTSAQHISTHPSLSLW